MSSLRIINYALTQSDVDTLYNQGRCNEAILGDEWRSGSALIIENQRVEKAVTPWYSTTRTPLTPIVVGKKYNVVLEVISVPTDYAFAAYGVRFGNNWLLTANTAVGVYNYSVIALDNSFIAYLGQTSDQSATDGKFKIISIKECDVLDEFTPTSLTSTQWKNTGVNTTPLTLTNPQFTTHKPFELLQYGSGAPSITPVAIGQEYYDYTNKKKYVCCGKPNTRQFAVSDWVIMN